LGGLWALEWEWQHGRNLQAFIVPEISTFIRTDRHTDRSRRYVYIYIYVYVNNDGHGSAITHAATLQETIDWI